MIHSTGLGIGWLWLALGVWALAVAGSVWAGSQLVNRLRPRPRSLPSPLELLQRRYAAGQIDRKTLDEARARLRAHDLDR